ncbi:hypothetical protein D9756_000451 [Leucocoprinus leucothites]|uniref:Uncharacterized protein n=1 Tax=Leucocoprinus leucothites TaxID=201217 RepID=A0A8H5GFN2_9AGAR|nr:hypothetical protein D9756_000451 [Leucoagaricus leucothites]
MADQESKLPLPQFLKILTNNGIPAAKAMAITGKIYKMYNTPSHFNELTDPKLAATGVSDKDDRKLVLTAFRKAGYVYKGKAVTKKEAIEKNIASSPGAGPSALSPTTKISPSKRKRMHSSDNNEYLPDGSQEEHTESLEFNEVLDEEKLRNKSCVINRAPVMAAWSMIVAECLGFKRDEALSIGRAISASVYTEMNAVSKGISLGVFKEGKGQGMEASSKGSQPYVDIMGRRIPLFQTQEGHWRALSSGSPVFPGSAFSYISRSFKQTTPFIIGALRLLALSYPPKVLNHKGWSLYADFRPGADGWGKRSEVKCDAILNLRHRDNTILSSNRQAEVVTTQPGELIIKVENCDVASTLLDEPQSKKARTMTLEGYEAVLDNNIAFDNVHLETTEFNSQGQR